MSSKKWEDHCIKAAFLPISFCVKQSANIHFNSNSFAKTLSTVQRWHDIHMAYVFIFELSTRLTSSIPDT